MTNSNELNSGSESTKKVMEFRQSREDIAKAFEAMKARKRGARGKLILEALAVHRAAYAARQEFEIWFIDAETGTMIYRRNRAGLISVMGFTGVRQKPNFAHSFKTEEGMKLWLSEWLQNLRAVAVYRAGVRAQRAQTLAGVMVAVDDVFYESWGYEQTNVDFYQVVELVGKQTVRLRKLKKEVSYTTEMQGEFVPVFGEFVGEVFSRRVQAAGTTVYLKMSTHSNAYPLPCQIVDGVRIYEPKAWSSYA